MKLKMIYLLSLLACAGLVVRAQTDQSSRSIAEISGEQKSAESILEKDKMNLEKNISKEVLSSQSWGKVSDYSLPVKEFVNLNNARTLFYMSGRAINDLSICLKKDFCGMERKNEDDAYFDDAKTPGHILLGRNLEVLSESLDRLPELAKFVDWETIRDLSENSNEKIQVLAVALLKKHGLQEGTTEKLLKIADNYKGTAKARAFVEISRDSSEEGHSQLLNAITKSFASDDPDTAISVMEKLSGMHLSFREMEIVANYLCHFKEDEGDDHNWKMIKYQMGKLSIQMDTVCP